MILYNLRHAGDQYRITKLIDGEVASSYLCTPTECQCPRGEYPTCRHRQMLPTMLNQGLCDSEWFLDWDDGHGVMDLHGQMRLPPEPAISPPHSVAASTADFDSASTGSNPVGATNPTPAHSWRRL